MFSIPLLPPVTNAMPRTEPTAQRVFDDAPPVATAAPPRAKNRAVSEMTRGRATCGRRRNLRICTSSFQSLPARIVTQRRRSPRSAALGFVCGLGLPRRYAVTVVDTERAGRLLGQRVAVALAVGSPHEGGNHLEIPVRDLAGL